MRIFSQLFRRHDFRCPRIWWQNAALFRKTAMYLQAVSVRLASAAPSPTGYFCLRCISCCREISASTVQGFHNIVARPQDHLETRGDSVWPWCRNSIGLRVSTKWTNLLSRAGCWPLQTLRSLTTSLVEIPCSPVLDISKWRLHLSVNSLSQMLLLCVPAHSQSSARSKRTCYCAIRDKTRERSRSRARNKARERRYLWRTQ